MLAKFVEFQIHYLQKEVISSKSLQKTVHKLIMYISDYIDFLCPSLVFRVPKSGKTLRIAQEDWALT